MLFLLLAPVLSISASSAPAPKFVDFADAFARLSAATLPGDLAEPLKQWFGADKLKIGASYKSDDLRFVFALETAPGEPEPILESDDGAWSQKLRRVGKSDLWALATSLPEGAGFRWKCRVGDSVRGGGELEAYTYPADTKRQPGVPEGKLIPQAPWKSQIFEGTTRDWWVYVPAQYSPDKPACVAVIQDGQWSRGYWTPVLDNLIAKKEIPVTIAIFLKPGTKSRDLDNRSVEYDTVSDRYPRFLIEEILPEVEKTYKLRQDANGRLVAGLSSGGICAFNAAWQRPDAFSKVISWIGSFTNLQGGPTGVAGGNTFPAIIRERRGWDEKGEPKPIRVFLQDGASDLDNKAGNWPLSSQQMAKALAFGKYDFKFAYGNGFHSDKHGRALLPETLRWIWRDEPK